MRPKALYDYPIIPIQIDWRFAKKRPAGFKDRLPCVRSLHGLATSVPVIGLHAAVFCGLFLPHAILYNKKQHDRIC